ncbi:MerR family transcriptional regulator [Vogesella sp. LIG4]|uniref:MerR family transcriptional regulator n=1 Tax=Vogesella sp. LIG4 TaxID=1192162 RepID=UPI00081F8ABD|nr:MerR family transcriptional regulator [Vogesella sp. LIG4]SCK26041.1 Predicted transcriptional regulators [Vogesella sp. LIG4]
MSVAPTPTPAGLPIAAVERETGIPKDLLRMWERRYGFPQPERDAAGDRQYSAEEVLKLRLISRLLNLGFRPGKLVRLDTAALQALTTAHAPPLEVPANCNRLVAVLQGHAATAVREYLRHQLLEQGLRRFVLEFLPLANRLVGDAWLCGELQVHEEHLYSEEVTRVIRESLATVPAGRQSPRVMLTTCPGEQHVLGLLMVEALLRLHGCDTIAFGAQMPLSDIVRAAGKHAVDVVVLSFSSSYQGNAATELAQLSPQLPAQTQLWVGGDGCRQLGSPPPRVCHVRELSALDELVDTWLRHA